MKKIFSILSFMSVILICHSQVDWGNITFDDTTWNNYIFIDTINCPYNIWQVGKPDKSNFNLSYSIPNAIVTDTINSYPINNTSIFSVRYITPNPPMGDWEITAINFIYQIDAEQDADFGKLEFSTDNGQTWIDYLTDTLFNYCYYSNNTYSFTGSSPEWQYFSLTISPQSNCFNMLPGDTLWYKFTFISDDMQSSKDGWMIDDIQLWDIYEGINNNNGFKSYLYTYPNPAHDFININFIGNSNIDQIIIYNHLGQKALDAKPVNNTLDVSKLKPGIYMLEVETKEWMGRTKLIIE